MSARVFVVGGAVVVAVVVVLLPAAVAGGVPGRNGAILYATDAAENFERSAAYLVDPESGDRRLLMLGPHSVYGSYLGVSPDGRKIIYSEPPDKVYVRDLAEPAPVELGGAGRFLFDFAWSPDSSRFAVGVWDGPDGADNGIYTAHADGSELRQLTQARASKPAWSPDGRRIAFSDGTCVRVVDAAGGAPPDCVAPLPFPVWPALAWSPDGRTLAASGQFRCTEAFFDCAETLLVDVDRRQARPLLAGTSAEPAPSGFPAWSPDGRMLALAARAVVIIDAATGARRTLAGEGALANEVAWSPDGTMLAYTRGGRGLSVIRVDGGGEKLLYPHDHFSGIRWSPQGILASAWTPHGDEEIVVGGPERPLTTNEIDDLSPAVSPDGRLVAYTERTREDDLTGNDGTIVVSTIDGGARLRLLRGGEPSWSPDGTALAFDRVSSGIYVVDVAAGARPRLLVRNAGSPAWSPDGRTIAFDNTWLGGEAGTRKLGLVDPDGRHKRFLPLGGDSYYSDPAWSPDGKWIAYGAYGRHQQLEAIHPDGRGRRTLTAFGSVPTGVQQPAWSPDGKSILVAMHQPPATDPSDQSDDIYELRADGRWPITLADARLLTPPRTSETWPAWQPLCTIYGSDGPDTLTGTSGADVICGLGGDDTIKAGPGNDIVIGGDGNDRIDGGPGNDRLFGARGNDTITARDGTRDVIDGGPGRDTARRDAADPVRLIER